MLKQLEAHYNNKLPFVVFRTPNSQTVKCYLQNDNTLNQVTDYTDQGFIFAPFKISKLDKAILFSVSNCDIHSFEYEQNTKAFSSNIIDEDNNLLPDSHRNIIDLALNDISESKLQKVVLSRPFSFKLETAKPFEIFEKMLNAYASAFVYCWYHPKVGIWLGATPETLINLRGNQLSTMSLAGTQKFEVNSEVKWQEKELDEQQIVTNYIVHQLEKAGIVPKQIISNQVNTIRAGNLWHLQTKIDAIIDSENFSLKNLLHYLHPTPAVCGAPKETAQQFIEKHEGYSRQYYTGFLGEINLKQTRERNKRSSNIENSAYKSVGKQTQLYVNLRCMQLLNNKAIIYVGGGITKGSEPESEWQELLSKLQTVKSVL